MSIYSGFPTRRDESKYNQLLSRLILMMQQHLMEFIEGTELAHKKIMGYTKVISKMKEFQDHKYLPPKFTELLEPLCKAIGYHNVAVSYEEVQIGEDKNKTKLERINTVKFSTEKPRLALKTGDQSIDYGKFNKKGPLYDQASGMESLTKKKMFGSSSNNIKVKKQQMILSKQRAEILQLNQAYEQQESVRTHSRSEHTRILTSHSTVTNKIKNNLRYRGFNALTEAQENIQKRQVPLRQEMKRKLKTEQGTEPQL